MVIIGIIDKTCFKTWDYGGSEVRGTTSVIMGRSTEENGEPV